MAEPYRRVARQTGAMPERRARSLWSAIETIHAVTYFHPACLDGWKDAGSRGFWMGYFVGRMAPLGAVPGSVAEAVAFGFAAERPRRALPDGWSFVDPDRAIVVRAESAAAALRATGIDEESSTPLAATLAALAAGIAPGGRPLGAANQAVPAPADPVAALWQACTTLRELRGDAHVALWVGAGLDGAATNVLTTAVHDQPAEVLRAARAFTDEEWAAAANRLVAAGLLDAGSGTPTAAGRALHAHVERRTDEICAADYERAPTQRAVNANDATNAPPSNTANALEPIIGAAEALADRIRAAAVIPFPNPMGLPPS